MPATFQLNILSCNIVGHNVLHMFVDPVVICCNMLDDIRSNLIKKVKFFVQHFGCCMMLYFFGHVDTTLLD